MEEDESPVALTRDDLDRALDRLEDMIIGVVKMVRDAPQVAETMVDKPEDIPEEVLDLPTPERESENVSVKRRRYI
jgi:hypothetical protein